MEQTKQQAAMQTQTQPSLRAKFEAWDGYNDVHKHIQWAAYEAGAALTPPVSAPKFPDLYPVITWLEGGCDPLDAAKELRLYQKQAGGALPPETQQKVSAPIAVAPEAWQKAMRDMIRVLSGVQAGDDSQWPFIANVIANAEDILAAPQSSAVPVAARQQQDLLDIVRSLTAAVAHMRESKNYPSPLAEGSPLPVSDKGAVESEALRLLAILFDSWENGTSCADGGEGAYIGNAFKLDDDVFDACCELLNKHAPKRAALSRPPAVEAPSDLTTAEMVEHIATLWDGCKYDAVGGDKVDIGALIRGQFKYKAALPAPLPKAEAVSDDLRKHIQAVIAVNSTMRDADRVLLACAIADALAPSAALPVATVVSRSGNDLRVGWLRPENCEVGTMLFSAPVAQGTQAVPLSTEILWQIHGALKDAGRIELAHKVADATQSTAIRHDAKCEYGDLPGQPCNCEARAEKAAAPKPPAVRDGEPT